MKQLVELQALIPPAHRQDTPIVAVSTDPLEKYKSVIPTVTSRTGGGFVVTLLSDAQHQVTGLYGLLNEAAAKRGRFFPYPATYVIDKAGRVRWRFTSKNQALRPTNEMILAELKKLW